jgi:hypothetical protein
MKRFAEGKDRTQGFLLPEFLDDYVAEDNPVRAIDVFVDELGPVLKLQRGDSRITESVIHGEPSILEASDAALRVARRSVRAG